MNIVVMGPVGSGKSTQAGLIAKEFNYYLFNIGDLLYFKSKEDSKEGKEVARTMEAGNLVDDKVVLRLVEDHLKKQKNLESVVIDGFPRSLWQAQNFSIPLASVIYLKVSDEENKKRLLARARPDDTSEIIEKRLAIYHRETQPILAFYKTKGILYEVDGERSVDLIFNDIDQILRSL